MCSSLDKDEWPKWAWNKSKDKVEELRAVQGEGDNYCVLIQVKELYWNFVPKFKEHWIELDFRT